MHDRSDPRRAAERPKLALAFLAAPYVDRTLGLDRSARIDLNN